MRNMLIATVLVVIASGGVTSAGGGLSETYAAWASGPESFLMTKDDLKQWKAIGSDAEAKRFIDLFWARRDPNPETPFNEFRLQFEQRVRQADKEFTWENQRGALTDRGQVLILLGMPQQIEHRAPTETVALMDDLEAGSDEVRANAWMWSYDPERLPAGVKIKGSRVLFVYYEEKAETNNFVLDRSHREAPLALRALAKAPEALVARPDLTEVPTVAVAVGAKPADAAHLAWLETASAPWSDRVVALLEAGVADSVHRPVWLHLQLPGDAPVLDELAGRVTNAAGEVSGTFQLAAKAFPSGSGRVYHITFPLESGSYRVDVAGAAAGQPQLKYTGEVQLDPIPADGTWLSPIWVGLSAEREEGAALGQAYCFAGWHLMPLVAEEVARSSELSYFGFVVRPGLKEGQQPAMRLKIAVSKDGKQAGAPATVALPMAPIGGDLYLFANALPFNGFPGAGEYLLSLTITDPVSAATIEREIKLKLVD